MNRCSTKMYRSPWIIYIVEQSGKGKSRKELSEGYKKWKTKKFGKQTKIQRTVGMQIGIDAIHAKSAGFYKECTINQNHLKAARKTFNSLSWPTSGGSLCANLGKLYALPGSCVLNRSISVNHSSLLTIPYLVYSGTYKTSYVYVKVAKLCPNNQARFDYMVLMHKIIRRQPLQGVVKIPELKASGRTLNDSLGFYITSAVEGVTLHSQVKKTIPGYREHLMKKVGVAFANVHKVASHGDAHFNNMLVTPAGKLALIDFDTTVVFDQSGASTDDITACRLYDLMFITFSIFSRCNAAAPTLRDSAEHFTFLQAYREEVNKHLPAQQVSAMMSSLNSLFVKHFANKTFRQIEEFIYGAPAKRYERVLEKAIRNMVRAERNSFS